jgi:hypothetical protein
MLEQLLPPHDVEMPPDLRVFAREALNVGLREGPTKTHVEFAGEL